MTSAALVAKTGIGFGDETLSVYDEGTWVPTITCSVSGTITPTSSTGSYVRVGNMVTATLQCLVASVSSPSGAIFATLPFTAKSTGTGQAGVASLYLFATGIAGVVVSIETGSTVAKLYSIADTGIGFTTANKCIAGASFTMSFTYFI